MTAFGAWFDLMVTVEGGALDLSPGDPGNYTPDGVLKGSRYGISARQFPDVDIANLTKDAAAALAKPLYWDAHRLDEVPAPFALLLADAYYNGADAPEVWLQEAVGATPDGIRGPETLGAAKRILGDPTRASAALGEFAARHLAYHARLDRPADELGWARRDVTTLLAALRLASEPLS
jgi:lysozyme family protein